MRRKGDTSRKFTSARGSLTVEASFIVPIVLICILVILNQGIELYTQTVETAQKQEMWKELEPVKRFRNLELVKEATG